jgi:hypothetical protein
MFHPSHEEMELGPGQLATVCLYSIYIIAYVIVVLLHTGCVVLKRESNYHVAARVPGLTVIELLLNGIIVAVVGCREVLAAVGMHVPCGLMVFVSLCASMVYLPILALRGINYIVTFEPPVRRKLMRLVNQRYLVAISVVLVLLAAGGAVVTELVPAAPSLCLSGR